MTGRYKAYPEYKSTNEVWLGDVPSHWRALQINRLTVIKRGASPRPIDDPKYFDEEGEYAWVRIADVTASDTFLQNTTQRLSSLGASLSVKLEPNALFLSIAGTVGKPCINKIKACIHDGFVYFPEYKENVKFLFYIFAAGEAYKGLGKFGTQLNLNTETVGGIKIGIPCIEEQNNIVNFLDHETAKIDTLITKQEKLIELLKEKRQAVVSHAVTKGLNPDAPMKDSGVEWLGEVPEHWDLKRFKHLFKIRKRIAGQTGYDILSITQKGIKVKDITSGEGQLSMDYSKYQLVYQGDYAMNHMDLLTGFVDISSHNGVTSPDYRVFTLEHKLSAPSYYLRLLQMGYLDKLFYPLGQGAAHIGRWRLPTEAFNEFIAPCPPYEEQKEISDYIDKNHRRIDSLLEKAQGAIILMKERKTALISAAVTGKIDVRNWQEQTKQQG
ncbi:hypothetical protein BK411_01990 [Vibrio splendidus]|nr:hypothetical protein BK411_01990 [Vibrio splendidus]